MVDRQARGLHEGVHDHGADEPEPSLLQVLAYDLRFGSPKRDAPRVLEPVDRRLVVHVAPHVVAERSEFAHDLH